MNAVDREGIHLEDVVAVELFWTSAPGLFARLIRRVTRGQWSHCGIIFALRDGRRVYYESLFEHGVAGPHPLEKLIVWAVEPEHDVELWPIPWLSDAEARNIARRATETYGAAGYGRWQIISHWWFERVGRRYGFRMRNTPSRVTCAEYVARACFPEYDLRDSSRDYFDGVTPQSTYERHIRIMHSLRGGDSQ